MGSPNNSVFLLGLVCVGFGVTTGISLGCPQALPLTETTVRLHNTCYQFVYEERRWSAARDFCWENGGRLVKVGSQEINQFLIDTLENLDQWSNNGVWIGLHDKVAEQRFQWIAKDHFTADEALEWSRWADGHPESWGHNREDCVRMDRDTEWRWKETSCSSLFFTYRFICEYDALVTLPSPNPFKTPGSLLTSRILEATTRANQAIPHQGGNEMFSTRSQSSTVPADDNVVHMNGETATTKMASSGGHQILSQDHPGDENKINPRILVIFGVAGSVIGAVALCLAIILIAMKRRKKSTRARQPSESPADKIVYSVKGKTVTYKLDEGQPVRPGNLYEGHKVEASAPRAPRVPGTPYPRSGQPPSFPGCSAEEDGYMVPRGAEDYIPMSGSSRGSMDPLPDIPDDKYNENPYESLDDIQEAKNNYTK